MSAAATTVASLLLANDMAISFPQQMLVIGKETTSLQHKEKHLLILALDLQQFKNENGSQPFC